MTTPTLAVVLIVDDESTVRSTARAILARAGYEVHVAESGKAAISLLQSLGNRVRVILLDWTLPDVNGSIVLAEAKRLAPRARVIVSTGFGRDDVALDPSDRDRVSFLEKPYTAAALMAAVAECLGDGSSAS